MGDAGQDDAFEIRKDRVYRFRSFGRVGRQRIEDRARPGLRAHRKITQTPAIIDAPFGRLAAPVAKFVFIHARHCASEP